MSLKITWHAKGKTIVAKAFRGDGLTYRAEHEFPHAGAAALFWLVIAALSREVAENA